MVQHNDKNTGKKIPIDDPPFDPDVPSVAQPKVIPIGDPPFDPDEPQLGGKDLPHFPKSTPKPKPKPKPQVDPFPSKKG